MTASEKKKRNQVILLVILSAVLLVVVYWQYLLSPLLTSCDELDEEIFDNEMLLSDMQSEIISIPGYERDIEDTFSRISEKTAELYPVMNTEDADMMLLSGMSSSGLSASSLSVSSASAGDEKDGSDNTGVYIITAVYNAKGSYSSLLRFVSRVNDMPAVVISSVSGTAEASEDKSYTVTAGEALSDLTQTPASERDMTFEITVQVYMYSAPDIPEHFDEPASQTLEAGSDERPDYLL